MPNWLSKTTDLLPREAKDPPQTFQLTCECAERHTGQRLSRPQRIVCQTCGAALFVLPKDAYPALRERSGPPRRRRKRPSKGVPRGPGLPSLHQAASSVRTGLFDMAGYAGRSLVAGITALRNGTRSTITSVGKSIREFMTPFRVVCLVAILLIVATSGFAIRSRVLESARTTLRTSLEAGQAALDEQDFVTARNHLAKAVTAVDTLGADDPQSHLVRQLHRETVALTNLAPASLFAMLEEAESRHVDPGTLSWDTLFETRFSGEWLVMNSPIRRDAVGFLVDVPLVVGADRREVVVRADLSVFERLSFVDELATAVFAAPLTGCELNDAQDRWIVTLDADAGFLWETLDNLRPLGFLNSEWVDENAIEGILEVQAQINADAK